jgi:hypothetical protein
MRKLAAASDAACAAEESNKRARVITEMTKWWTMHCWQVNVKHHKS